MLLCIAVLQGVDEGAFRVPQVHGVGPVLPIHAADEVSDRGQAVVGAVGGHDQQAIRGDDGPGEIDGSVL